MIGTVLAAVVPSLLILLLSKKFEAYHGEVNSKMNQLLKLKGESERAKGNLDGRAELKEEQK